MEGLPKGNLIFYTLGDGSDPLWTKRDITDRLKKGDKCQCKELIIEVRVGVMKVVEVRSTREILTRIILGCNGRQTSESGYLAVRTRMNRGILQTVVSVVEGRTFGEQRSEVTVEIKEGRDRTMGR